MQANAIELFSFNFKIKPTFLKFLYDILIIFQAAIKAIDGYKFKNNFLAAKVCSTVMSYFYRNDNIAHQRTAISESCEGFCIHRCSRKIRGAAAGKSQRPRCPGVSFLKMKPCLGAKRS